MFIPETAETKIKVSMIILLIFAIVLSGKDEQYISRQKPPMVNRITGDGTKCSGWY